MDDILLNKAQTIERCFKRIREVSLVTTMDLNTDYMKQDSIILNIQRACEAAIDMGIRVLRLKHLGIPQTSKDVFVLLEQERLISTDLSKKMQAMVGFRNIAVHDYTSLNLDIVQSIVENGIEDMLEYSRLILLLQST